MQFKPAIIATSALALGVNAFWRMECRGYAAFARVDPLISPNEVSQHAHAIHGSSGFSPSATYEDLMAGQCTTCLATQDKSAYWAPALYFQDAATGKYELVDQVGGMLAYYNLNSGPLKKDKIKAFPKGFRMIAGDNLRRDYTLGNVRIPDPATYEWSKLNQTGQADLAQRAVGFNCLNYNKNPPEGSLTRHYLPDKAYIDANCVSGMRFELAFPTCWNGRDTDSPNHRDHVAYPTEVLDGFCPDGFNVRVPGLFYETIWNTPAYAQRAGRFVIANGDLQGFAYHGDYMMGWDETLLQQAVDTCTNLDGELSSCPLFKLQSEEQAQKCVIPIPQDLKAENVKGPVAALPGNVAIIADTVPVSSVGYTPGVTATAPGQFTVGGIFALSSQTTPAAAPAPTPPSPPPPAPPAVTPSPSSDPLAVSTDYKTVGNMVTEIIWHKTVVTVTQDVDVTSIIYATAAPPSPQPAKVKARFAGKHLHRHRARHGAHAF